MITITLISKNDILAQTSKSETIDCTNKIKGQSFNNDLTKIHTFSNGNQLAVKRDSKNKLTYSAIVDGQVFQPFSSNSVQKQIDFRGTRTTVIKTRRCTITVTEDLDTGDVTVRIQCTYSF